MKRSIALLLAAVLLLAGVPAGIFADDAAETAEQETQEVQYAYRTQTLRVTDRSMASEGLTAAISVPYYMGTVNAVLNTRLGEAESQVMVLYVPTEKWDGDCLYGAVTADLKPFGIRVYPGSDLVIAWKDMYTYGFLDVQGGMYSFDGSTMIMHFTAGPGLYTGVAAIPVTQDLEDPRTYEQALREATEAGAELSYLPVGYNFVLALNDEMIDYFLANGKLEKISSYSWPGLKELIERSRYEVQPPKPETGLANFKIKRAYIRGQYVDMPYYVTNWYDEFVARCSGFGLLNGYRDNTFRPQNSITLAECLAIACSMRDQFNGGDGTFPSGSTPWYTGYVNYAIRQGIIRERDFEDFSRSATRAEVAYIFSRVFPKGTLPNSRKTNPFSDVTSGTPYRSSIIDLYRAGAVSGYKDGTFHPSEPITRAEVCVIISNMIGSPEQQ